MMSGLDNDAPVGEDELVSTTSNDCVVLEFPEGTDTLASPSSLGSSPRNNVAVGSSSSTHSSRQKQKKSKMGFAIAPRRRKCGLGLRNFFGVSLIKGSV